jgi:hypothetical protein
VAYICFSYFFGKQNCHKLIMFMVQSSGTQIFQKSRGHLKILGTRRATWSKFHTKDPQTIDATVQNLVAQATWCLRFVHLWYKEPHFPIVMVRRTKFQSIVSKTKLQSQQAHSPNFNRYGPKKLTPVVMDQIALKTFYDMANCPQQTLGTWYM